MTSVVCNPVNLAYRYQDLRPMSGGRTVHREAADPSVIRYRGRFYLFASMAAGFWHSADLRSWEYRASTKLAPLDYAPDVREVNGVLYVSASRQTDSPFYRSEDPLADDFTLVNPGFPFWDPHLFQDDDGAVYFYWGCSHKEPVTGVRVDPDTMDRIGEPVPLFGGAPDRHGWEQIGENHVKTEPTTELAKRIAEYLGGAPFIEGAWMTRHQGTYYLQYAAPGTEWNTYADGYYTSSSPLGPFEYATNSPFSSKPGGFITGAGHGSTFQDEHGNWWHASTMRVSVHHEFERRVGIFPAGFDADGVLFCNQNFRRLPDARAGPPGRSVDRHLRRLDAAVLPREHDRVLFGRRAQPRTRRQRGRPRLVDRRDDTAGRMASGRPRRRADHHRDPAQPRRPGPGRARPRTHRPRRSRPSTARDLPPRPADRDAHRGIPGRRAVAPRSRTTADRTKTLRTPL
jgi:xylan 1,4-beta-xylosidase